MEIFNVGNKSINVYLLVSRTHRLLIDSGFPNSLSGLGREMRKTGFRVSDIDFLIVTHFHIDHAGAIQEIKDQGVKYILLDVQKKYIEPMEKMAVGKWQYTPLKLDDNVFLEAGDSREFLKSIGLKGVIVSTPGHSKDSISMVLDSGEAFTGDLYAQDLLGEIDLEQLQSWKTLKRLGVNNVFPGHGKTYRI
ncbi:MAG TPA: MBL fold metallo-hydrolase [Cytophagaceae bacterium]|jgi:glyoxylase-like metal-dependent hydrolase (beta-lactamase superfamily II)